MDSVFTSASLVLGRVRRAFTARLGLDDEQATYCTGGLPMVV